MAAIIPWYTKFSFSLIKKYTMFYTFFHNITYLLLLSILTGINQVYDNKILYYTNDYVNDYNIRVDPSVLNEHSTAAFRYFHSLIAGHLKSVLFDDEYKYFFFFFLSNSKAHCLNLNI